MNTNTYILLTVVFAGLLQSGFSLGTSMLLLLSGHQISARRSRARLLHLSGCFVLGSIAMTILLLMAATFVCLLYGLQSNRLLFLLSGASTVLAGIWFLFFYYRRGRGTALWIPRSFARYLNERTRLTRSGSEAFVLGTAGVLYELPFTIGLITTAALQIALLPGGLELPGVLAYAGLAALTLLILFVLVAQGRSSSQLNRWRAGHKRFLQVITGVGLVALGASVSLGSVYEALAARGIILW